MECPLPARVIDLGLRDYGEVWQTQLELVAARQRGDVPDTLLLVEHPHVLTMGRRTKRENLLAPAADMPLFEIERGGDVTYHGPGQLVAYPLFLLRLEERDLHLYLRDLQETLIRTLAAFGVPAGRRAGWTGAWTAEPPPRKLASIGVAVKKWVTMHGIALNVSTDLSRFAAINPCGLDAAVMASISSCRGKSVTIDEVAPQLVRDFGDVFGRSFEEVSDDSQPGTASTHRSR